MEYREKIILNKHISSFIKTTLDGHPELVDNNTLTYTATFPNQYSMDIKLCYAPLDEGGAWSEAVLFNESNRELVCTEVVEDYFGIWELECKGDTYIVDVLETEDC